MKYSLKSLTALAVLGLAALPASAQPAVKIAVVDMAKLYDTHYKTVEQNAKIQADDQKAQEEVERMNKEGNALVEEYKNLSEQASSPALSAEAKSKAQNEAQKKLELIQNKQREVQTFIQNTRNSLSQRLNTFRGMMLEEIAKVATELAKKRGATLLLDKAGPTAIGISNILYSDAAYDLTDEVAKEVNKDKPVGAPSAPAAPAAAPAAGATPAVSVPGLPSKK
ncbi:MAG: OmpH family outer membrane protein [Verrucomicrobia bacterium]|nr:OmpH family outer membrane protein [Verrucomicrobiota bacterium]